MYLSREEYNALGKFDLIWCTGVLYHNTEQLRFLRKLFQLTNPGGWLVLESATLRGPKYLTEGAYVQIYWPDTYRNTTTVTHLPSKGAIRAWLQMVGFWKIVESNCFEGTPKLIGQRMAILATKGEYDDAKAYYTKTGLNPEYRFGDSL